MDKFYSVNNSVEYINKYITEYMKIIGLPINTEYFVIQPLD